MLLGQHSQRRNAGFTFIELLIVTAIIAIPLGLSAVWFVKGRQTANQAQSLDNLRQLADATFKFNSTWKMFPPGVGYFPRQRPGAEATLFHILLPDLNNDTNVFRAPGDPSLPANNILKNGLEACSYAGNGYVFWGDEGLTADDIARDSPPKSNININPMWGIHERITDGASVTILFMEKYATCNVVSKPRKGYEENAPGQHGWADSTLLGKNIGTEGYYSNFTPIQISLALPQFQPHLLDADCKLAQGFASGTIVVSMADGSCRKVSSSVSQQIWGSALLPNDGFVMPAGDW